MLACKINSGRDVHGYLSPYWWRELNLAALATNKEDHSQIKLLSVNKKELYDLIIYALINKSILYFK